MARGSSDLGVSLATPGAGTGGHPQAGCDGSAQHKTLLASAPKITAAHHGGFHHAISNNGSSRGDTQQGCSCSDAMQTVVPLLLGVVGHVQMRVGMIRQCESPMLFIDAHDIMHRPKSHLAFAAGNRRLSELGQQQQQQAAPRGLGGPGHPWNGFLCCKLYLYPLFSLIPILFKLGADFQGSKLSGTQLHPQQGYETIVEPGKARMMKRDLSRWPLISICYGYYSPRRSAT